MKIPIKTASWIAALVSWLLLSALTVFIIMSMRDRARLIRDNDNERLFSVLFTSLRDYEDAGSAIESSPLLRGRIAGFGFFGEDLKPAYGWGTVPPVLDEELLQNHRETGPGGRYTIPDRQGSRVKFILRTRPEAMPRMTAGREDRRQHHEGPPGREQNRRGRMTRRRSPEDSNGTPDSAGIPPVLPAQPSGDVPPEFAFFSTLARSKYIYIDVTHPAYWRTWTLTAVFFPFCELALLGLVFFVRRLYLKNREYRERIESQKNLVVLGTAASTLAHEIKNPLLSIRLQTGILRKIFPETGKEELAVIDDEVGRLSAMTYRVNDFLRDALGNPVPVNSSALLSEISRRLCGEDIVDPGAIRDGVIFMDRERARSVFENLIRNALESGGPAEEIRASVTRSGGRGQGRRVPVSLAISITDRGRGIPPADLGRVFDPFFTSKSAGAGIGLSISRRFIEAAGGTIVLENREGGGAVARIVLPEYKGEGSCGF
ncbi:MAG: HAMP domain-containing histidine kinase [Treponema sp.]|jgi:two-component system sensor histidine kinase HydH|nr:HAMP domain-containing histidine kinase [Treponema sp.]